MRFASVTGAALAAAMPAMGRELPVDEARAAAFYDNGMVHETLMKHKIEQWKAEEAAGLMDSSKWPRLNYTKCEKGVAAAVPGDPLLTFRCKNVSRILHF